MKDLRYFLDEEDKYNQTKPVDNMVWDEEAHDWDFKHIPLEFLRKSPFHRSYETIDYIRKLTMGYDLNESELTVLGMFIMHCSGPFRDDYYELPIPELAKNMFEVLNNAISKAPLTQEKTLYRFCVDEDIDFMKVGAIMTIPYNLTCTINKWDKKDNNIYIIQTLPHNKTHAHDLYKMYPHNINEKQVNFIRGISFRITRIEEIEGTEYHTFYMDELEEPYPESKMQ